MADKPPGPLAFLLENPDAFTLAVVTAAAFSTMTAILKGATGIAVAVGHVASLILTAIVIGYMSKNGINEWTSWAAAGALIGVATLPMFYFLIRFCERVQNRAEDIADRQIDRFSPPPKPPAPPPATGGPSS